MGSENQSQISKQAQIVEQNYSNNIMFLSFSTLQSICLKFRKQIIKPQDKIFGKYDKVDYTQKSLSELLKQMKVHLGIFRLSKMDMEKSFKQVGGFTFPKDFTKKQAKNLLSQFKKICQKQSNKVAVQCCNDLEDILDGKYQGLSFQKQQDVIVSQNGKIKKDKIMIQGINAGNEMDKLKEQVIQQKVSQPQNLKPQFNQPLNKYEDRIPISAKP